MKFIPYLLILLTAGAWGYSWYEQELILEEYKNVTVIGSQYKQEVSQQRNFYFEELQKLIAALKEKNIELESLGYNLEREKEKIKEIEDEIGDALKTVKVLDKLSKTDEELLQKYSKVYFLNEHYIPSPIAAIPEEYLSVNKNLSIKSEVLPFLEALFEEAKDDGVDLKILSAYRSYEQQASIKYGYTVVYGTTAANTFSADQGYSEHQLGTTVDFTNTTIGAGLSGFKATPEYAWLLENAHKHGFILSYPEGNSYYQFEPWHWRFVGKELAEYLHDEEKGFYDIDQRKLNEYLISIFDN